MPDREALVVKDRTYAATGELLARVARSESLTPPSTVKDWVAIGEIGNVFANVFSILRI